MELDDLKGAWAQYDKKLSKNLNINVELLRSINFGKYNDALRKPMKLELLNIFIQIFMIGLSIFFLIRLSNEIVYFLTGLIGISMCTISLIFSVVKATRLNNLFHYHLSITNFQKDFSYLRILIIRLRKIEYVIAAIIGITLFPLIVKATADIDLLGNFTLLIPGICCTIGFGYALGIWLNLIVYDKGIKQAEMFLSMIDKFSTEE